MASTSGSLVYPVRYLAASSHYKLQVPWCYPWKTLSSPATAATAFRAFRRGLRGFGSTADCFGGSTAAEMMFWFGIMVNNLK